MLEWGPRMGDFSFLKYIETFYAQTNVCVCIYLHGRVSLEPQLQIWVQAAGGWGALRTCCTEVGG